MPRPMVVGWIMSLLLASFSACQGRRDTQAPVEVAAPESDPESDLYDHNQPGVPSQGPDSALEPPPGDSAEERIQEEKDLDAP